MFAALSQYSDSIRGFLVEWQLMSPLILLIGICCLILIAPRPFPLRKFILENRDLITGEKHSWKNTIIGIVLSIVLAPLIFISVYFVSQTRSFDTLMTLLIIATLAITYVGACRQTYRTTPEHYKKAGYWFGGPNVRGVFPIRWQGHIALFVTIAICIYIDSLIKETLPQWITIAIVALILFLISTIRTKR